MYYDILKSPFGPILMVAGEEGLTRVNNQSGELPVPIEDHWIREPSRLKAAEEQLTAYFAGELKHFDLPLAPSGTPFMKKVWKELTRIPYGQTRSYKEIATAIGNPGAGRAVGMANNRNPLHIVVPCHRVIGSNGSLTGYAGGLDLKQALLMLEQKNTMR